MFVYFDKMAACYFIHLKEWMSNTRNILFSFQAVGMGSSLLRSSSVCRWPPTTRRTSLTSPSLRCWWSVRGRGWKSRDHHFQTKRTRLRTGQPSERRPALTPTTTCPTNRYTYEIRVHSTTDAFIYLHNDVPEITNFSMSQGSKFQTWISQEKVSNIKELLSNYENFVF